MWGGNEDTGAKKQRVNVPQKPVCSRPPLTTLESLEEVQFPRQRIVQKHLTTVTVTEACASVGRDIMDQLSWVPGRLGHRLGHTCFLPETLPTLPWKIWVDRDLPLHPLLGLEVRNVPYLPSTLEHCYPGIDLQ